MTRRLKRRFYGALFPLYRALFPTTVARGAFVSRAARRLLVVRNDRIGDLILTTPALDELRALAPHAEIDVLASASNARLLVHDARVAQVHVHDGTAGGLVRLRRALRARRYDAVFSFIPGDSLRQGAAAAFAAPGGTARVSIWRAKRYHGFFTRVVRLPRSLQTGPVGAQLVGVVRAAFGARLDERMPTPSLAIPTEAREAAAIFAARHEGAPLVVVNLWAAGAERTWSVEECARALRAVGARHASWRFVLIPAPSNAREAERLRAMLPDGRVDVYAPSAPLLEVAALVARAAMVVTPDTMVLHLAAAARRPVVWLATTANRSDPTMWRPVGVPERALVTADGAPVRAIHGDRVAAAVESLANELHLA